jgi:hypothetical protein
MRKRRDMPWQDGAIFGDALETPASPEASIPPFPIAVSSSMAADDREHDQALTPDAKPVAAARLANTKARLSEAGRCGGGDL